MSMSKGRGERVSSGNKQADEILSGGFAPNSINIIMGQPGTGKSIFAEQLVFKNAFGERPILYLTTLSEPLSKMIEYLQRFGFYDETKIGNAVQYADIGADLAKEGISFLGPYIEKAILTLAPKIIVIDSFKALHDLASTKAEMRKMLYELTGLLTAYETTTFLLGEYSDKNIKTLPEFAVADGIIQFMRMPQSTRDERFLRVTKLRGSAYLEGSHAFSITANGLEVFPRLVTPSTSENYDAIEERVTSGIDGLDDLLGGGLWRGSTTLLAGPTGAGKTTAGLQFALEGARCGEPTMYINFQENPTQLARCLRGLGADLDWAKEHGLQFVYTSPVELQVDSIIVNIFRRIQESGTQRLVVDAIGDLISAANDLQRLHDYLYALVQHFAVNGVTSIMIFETTGALADHGFNPSSGGRLSYMSDNILLLSMDVKETVTRKIAILKERGSQHALGFREIEITDKGVKVLSTVKVPG